MNDGQITRRDFVSATVGVGMAAAGAQLSGQVRVLEMNVEIKLRTERAMPRSFIRRPARIPRSSSGPMPSVSGHRCVRWPNGW